MACAVVAENAAPALKNNAAEPACAKNTLQVYRAGPRA